MKITTSLICLFVILLISENILGQCVADYSTILSAPNLRVWNPIYTSTYFFDDFSGGTLSSTWNVKTGTVRNCNEEAQHYKNSTNNIDLSSGSTLKLIARRETNSDWTKCTSPEYLETKDYTSGDIETFDHTFQYGIYEIRAKYPVGNGAWAAFWHFGDYPPGIPACSENDLFEQNRNSGCNGYDIRGVFHWYGPNHCQSWRSSQNIVSTPTNWHVYKCIWTPYEANYYIDDVLCYHKSRYSQNGTEVSINQIQNGRTYTVFGSYPIYAGSIILNYALYSKVSIDNSVLPQSFEIDYIRVKQFFLAPEIALSTYEICTSGTATMDVDPLATNVTWQLTPSSLFTTASGTGKVATITKASGANGEGKITYTFQMPSGETFTAEKRFWVGSPASPEIIGNSSLTCNLYLYRVSDNSQVTWTVSGPLRISGTNYGYKCNIVGTDNGYGWIQATASNTCGSVMSERYVEVICGYYLIFSPNPGDGQTVVSIASANELESEGVSESAKSVSDVTVFDETVPWDLEVYTQNQLLKDRKTKQIGRSATINTSGWPEGLYIVKVVYNNDILTGRLIVKH